MTALGDKGSTLDGLPAVFWWLLFGLLVVFLALHIWRSEYEKRQRRNRGRRKP